MNRLRDRSAALGRRGRIGLIVLAVALATLLVGGAASAPAAEPAPAPTPPTSATAGPTPSPGPTPTPSLTPTPTPTPTPAPTPSPTPSPTPTPVPPPEVDPNGPTGRVATRVVVAALGIDLPVTRQRTSYPACNVAMYLTELQQPGQGGPTYLYAHARRGMFLALLERSRIANGASMIGMEVEVYTGDNMRFTYEIDRVHRHVRSMSAVLGRKGETLWLQTSEGPRGTIPKLQVAAHFVGVEPTTFAAAHPRPRPVAC